MLLVIKNIIINKLSKKLNYKFIRFYKILEKILENNYKLNLKSKKYLIFYILLLKLFKNIIIINNSYNYKL